VSEIVRKTIGQFYGTCFGKPSQRARGFGKDVARVKNIVVSVLAVPAGAAQKVANDLVDAGVRIIFNYSEGLLDALSDVTVHTSNPVVELLHALYFHLA
jgi:redox-sensing transcriptional repressor